MFPPATGGGGIMFLGRLSVRHLTVRPLTFIHVTRYIST